MLHSWVHPVEHDDVHIPHCHPHVLTHVVHKDEHASLHNAVHAVPVQFIRQLASHAIPESTPHVDRHPYPTQLDAQSNRHVAAHPPSALHPEHDLLDAAPVQ